MEKDVKEDENGLKYKILVFGMLLVAGFFALRGCYSEYELSKNYSFAIAITTQREPGGYVGYQYIINDKVFRNSDKAHRLTPNGKRYFVKFNPKDPSDIAKIVSNEEVLSCVDEQPKEGWKELPKCK